VECEVVVVDDKSSDNSVDLISRFMDAAGVWAGKACAECSHPPPKYTLLQHAVNQGAGVARNDGVAAARGQVILFGEADDVFYEHHAAVCWDMMRRTPSVGFVKMRMDAGKEYVQSSFVAHEVPVQELHPHWQVAIEDTSPMNLCVRSDAHAFIGGFPDGELFHIDMEDGAYMMCLYEAYGGVKWLSSPSTLYVRREGNGLDRRMLQFTNAPGTVALGELDAKHGDARMDLIDGNLALVRDRLAEYQAVDELLALDPVAGEGRELHRQRSLAFRHAYALARPTYTSSNPEEQPGAASGDVPGNAGVGSRDGGDSGDGAQDAGSARAGASSRYSHSEPHVIAVLYRGCRPRALRNTMAWLMYRALMNPLRTLLFVDQPYPSSPGIEEQHGPDAQQDTPSRACHHTEQVARMFPVDVRRFEGGLVRQALAARAPVAVAAAVHRSGGLGGVARGKDVVLLFELAHESRASIVGGGKSIRGGVGGAGEPRARDAAAAGDAAGAKRCAVAGSFWGLSLNDDESCLSLNDDAARRMGGVCLTGGGASVWSAHR
jgi:hypothetical protein